MNDMLIRLDTLLAAREERVKKRGELRLKYNKGAVVTLTLNIPGAVKQAENYRQFHHLGMKLLTEMFAQQFSGAKILYSETLDKMTGSEGYFYVLALAPLIKAAVLKFEEKFTFTKVYDIDVYDVDGVPVGREEFGYRPRRCYLCNNSAKLCAVAGKHSINEVLLKVAELIEEGFTIFERDILIDSCLLPIIKRKAVAQNEDNKTSGCRHA